MLCFISTKYSIPMLKGFDHSKKWKKKKYHTVGTVPKANSKIVERGTMCVRGLIR
jgi:hypothetical protein